MLACTTDVSVCTLDMLHGVPVCILEMLYGVLVCTLGMLHGVLFVHWESARCTLTCLYRGTGNVARCTCLPLEMLHAVPVCTLEMLNVRCTCLYTGHAARCTCLYTGHAVRCTCFSVHWRCCRHDVRVCTLGMLHDVPVCTLTQCCMTDQCTCLYTECCTMYLSHTGNAARCTCLYTGDAALTMYLFLSMEYNGCSISYVWGFCMRYTFSA